jgi:hypothetical protein
MTPRRVLVVRDTCSPLWHATCETPCLPDGTRCQVNPNRPQQPGICWIASGTSKASVTRLVGHCGRWEVVG